MGGVGGVLGQQRAQYARQHVARAGGRQPCGRGAGQYGPLLAVLLTDQDRHSPLEQHRRAGQRVRAARATPRFGQHIIHVDVLAQALQQSRQLGGVRRDQHLRRHTVRQQVERARIDHDRRHVIRVTLRLDAVRRIRLAGIVVAQQTADRLALDVVAVRVVVGTRHAGTDDPGLHMPLAQHRFGAGGQHHVLRPLRAQIPHHAHIRT